MYIPELGVKTAVTMDHPAPALPSAARSDQIKQAPPHVYFVVSAIFHYLGPSFAVLLFARVQVLGVAWLRIASAAVILGAWRRPWRGSADLDRGGRALLLAWGVTLAVMNACFYEAIRRLPLATVSATEFVPVIALAALGARSPRNIAALGLAVPGVYLLTHVRLAGATLGFAFAFANALLFCLYIVLADRVAKRRRLCGIDGLAGAMLIAAVVVTPIGGWQALPAFTVPLALLAGIGVGISSSVIPYVTDQLAMARLPRATYATMVALLPAVATVIGIVVLTQIPGLLEIAGLALVMAGVALHRPQVDEPSRQGQLATHAVAEVHDAAREPALVQELKLRADAGRERPLTATHHDRAEEQVALVDQTRGDRLPGKLGAPHGEIAS
jgi:inner membrane transporter RhtA